METSTNKVSRELEDEVIRLSNKIRKSVRETTDQLAKQKSFETQSRGKGKLGILSSFIQRNNLAGESSASSSSMAEAVSTEEEVDIAEI